MSFIADIFSAATQADSSRQAVNTQADTTREAIGEQRRQYDLTRADYQPWRDAGVNALQSLVGAGNSPMSADEAMQDPGYAFGMQQGQQALDRRFAAGGGRVSGASMKAASRYGTDYASTKYGQADERRNIRLNRLATIAGIGQTATGTVANAGMNSANQIGNMQTGLGNAQAGATMNQGRVWGNAANSIAALYGRSGGNGMQAAFSNTALGSSGFGNGLAYGNQDLGTYL